MLSKKDFQKKALEVLNEQKFSDGMKLFLEDDLSEFSVSDGSAELYFDDYIELLYNKLINI